MTLSNYCPPSHIPAADPERVPLRGADHYAHASAYPATHTGTSVTDIGSPSQLTARPINCRINCGIDPINRRPLLHSTALLVVALEGAYHRPDRLAHPPPYHAAHSPPYPPPDLRPDHQAHSGE